MIREEWEALERKEKQAKENKEKAKSRKEVKRSHYSIDGVLAKGDNLLKGGASNQILVIII